MMQNREERKDVGTLFNDTKSELKQYVEKRVESLKLRVYEKTAITGSFITYGLFVMLMVFFVFFLCLLTLGFFLGELLNSLAAGFGILVLCSLIILVIFIVAGKTIRRKIINLIVSLIKKIEKDEE